jgi:hypothetical protein
VPAKDLAASIGLTPPNDASSSRARTKRSSMCTDGASASAASSSAACAPRKRT